MLGYVYFIDRPIAMLIITLVILILACVFIGVVVSAIVSPTPPPRQRRSRSRSRSRPYREDEEVDDFDKLDAWESTCAVVGEWCRSTVSRCEGSTTATIVAVIAVIGLLYMYFCHWSCPSHSSPPPPPGSGAAPDSNNLKAERYAVDGTPLQRVLAEKFLLNKAGGKK